MDPAGQRIAYFPDEPPRFVGRAAPMARASAALAPESGQAGVLLHGMAGVGKLACALELAYRHQDSFAALGSQLADPFQHGLRGFVVFEVMQDSDREAASTSSALT